MPDVEKIMEPWSAGEQQAKKMPDFDNQDLLSVIDDVCGLYTAVLYYNSITVFLSAIISWSLKNVYQNFHGKNAQN